MTNDIWKRSSQVLPEVEQIVCVSYNGKETAGRAKFTGGLDGVFLDLETNDKLDLVKFWHCADWGQKKPPMMEGTETVKVRRIDDNKAYILIAKGYEVEVYLNDDGTVTVDRFNVGIKNAVWAHQLFENLKEAIEYSKINAVSLCLEFVVNHQAELNTWVSVDKALPCTDSKVEFSKDGITKEGIASFVKLVTLCPNKKGSGRVFTAGYIQSFKVPGYHLPIDVKFWRHIN